MQKKSPEGVRENRYPQKFSNIHRKIPVLETLKNMLWQRYFANGI